MRLRLRVIRCRSLNVLPSRKLTWKPKRGPIKTTVSLKRGYMAFHVSLGECTVLVRLLGTGLGTRSGV